MASHHRRHGYKRRKPATKGTQKSQCDMCYLRFPMKSFLYSHCNRVHQETVSKSWLQCPTCSNYFPPESIEYHARRVHPHDASLCQFCAKLVARNNFIKHANKRHTDELKDSWMTCKKCGWLVPDKEELAEHQKSQSCRSFVCQLCEAKFRASVPLKVHIKKMHPKEEAAMLHQCNSCLSQLLSADESHLCKDSWARGRTRRRRCKFCSKELASRKSYIEQSNTEHKEIIQDVWMSCNKCLKHYPDSKYDCCRNKIKKIKTYQCNFCDAVLKDSYSLNKHANRRHRFWLKRANWAQCKHCTTYFSDHLRLRRHIARKHGSDEAEKESRDRALTCGDCQEQFPDEQTLAEHQEKHSTNVRANVRTVACEFCSARLRRLNYVKHANHRHPSEVKEVWHACKVCSLYLDTKQALIRHIINRHTQTQTQTQTPAKVERQKLRCDFCWKELFDEQNLNHHVLRYHKRQMEKHWQCCQQCKMFFSTKHSLLAHQRRRHLDFFSSMVTTCQMCNSQFPTFESFCIHANRNHSEEMSSSSDWLICRKCLLRWPTEKLLEHQTECLNYERMKTTCLHCAEDTDSSGHHFNTKHRDKVAPTWHGCSDCQWYFYTDEQLQQHCADAHRSSEDCSGVSKYVSCSFCPEVFLRKSRLNYYQHNTTAHEDKVKSEWLKCQDCDARRPDLRELAYHHAKAHLTLRTWPTQLSSDPGTS